MAPIGAMAAGGAYNRLATRRRRWPGQEAREGSRVTERVQRYVIVGNGAAGTFCAETLRKSAQA